MSLRRKYPWTGWQIALVDAVLIALSFGISYYLRYEIELFRSVEPGSASTFAPFIPYTLIYILWMLVMNQGAGLYEDKRERGLTQEIFRMGNATSQAAVLVMALSFLFRPLIFSRLLIIQAAFIALVLLSLFRMVIRMIRYSLHRRGIGLENVLLVGAGEVGRHIIRTIVARPNFGYRLVGFADDNEQENIGRVPKLGTTNDLASLIRDHNIDLVIITLPRESQQRIVRLVDGLERQNVDVRIVPDFFQFNLSQVNVETLDGLPLIAINREKGIPPNQLLLKRGLDILLTTLIFPFALPLMGLTALFIRLDSEGPILFHQERIGLNGKPFKMIKFRSMVQDAEQLEGEIVVRTSEDPEGKHQRQDNDPRITKIGHFIRRSSIDELPQLFNVMRGDMSLVGPRPSLAQEVELYKAWQLQRFAAPPGITGLWQVSGRSDIPFEEKCLLDIYYIDNWNLGLDLQILVQTIPQVLFGKGAY